MDLFGNPTTDRIIESSAYFSPDRVWRYWLKRVWDPALELLCVIALNPSTADEKVNDPTIAKLIEFAKLWGYGGLMMMNLFGYRATDPDDMHAYAKAGGDAVGAENDETIIAQTKGRTVLCAWGADPMALGRDVHVYKLIADRKLICLGTNKGGSPKHPLYLAYTTPTVVFTMKAAS